MNPKCAHNGLVSSRQAWDLTENHLCIAPVLPTCAVGNITMSQAHVKDPNTTGKEGIFSNTTTAEMRKRDNDRL